jgi:NAD(P)-dependent dehydrogenase (short-subunit alcohol dehydrogenase family)
MSARRLEGKRCLITGGSRNLGLAICKAFGRAGAKVAFTWSKNTQDAVDARAALKAEGIEALDFQGSVADAAHVNKTIAALQSAWGGLDVLVNNAGLNQVLPIALIDEADWDAMMSVTVKGAYLYSRAALKSMIRQKRGHILSIGTFASERIVEAPVHYAAAKAALRGFTEALAREVGRYGISVNLLSPGILDVGLGRNLPQYRISEYLSQNPLGRVGSAEEMAELATFLVSEENSFMTGAKVVADGGL